MSWVKIDDFSPNFWRKYINNHNIGPWMSSSTYASAGYAFGYKERWWMWLQGCQMVCFQTKNPNLGKFGGSCNRRYEDGIFYGHLVHFTVFCYILWTIGMVCGNLVYIFPFWYFVLRKIWQPCMAWILETCSRLTSQTGFCLVFHTK
jgi:hypothetical protein